ncbi:purB: adenylosuccinate lyase [Rubrobacter radiotolerans]|uniref:Adenylosuccinate lyase n=1 Tax=Rubrobacter radiotolerans TaxID=42256 RepID=A0A023X298_RUBRA|nr:adenylosuccinate lyase [Rubrobacter radiotolerans]AHY46189.1 purB: adenylosuccinate lyase [Rubrobacter radiotolerans]MDX5893598.1 adenylosuccinate lyase [Rubrobacter radiotolerans]SMC04083.1 Adenylosuccinate lyase [Rubrobacter radiotolerans DSM 5868]
MIDRYTLPEIGSLWTEEAKYRNWLRVEIAVCRARAELGEIPAEEVEELAQKADFTVERIREIEESTNHDVIAFVSTVAETVDSPVSRHFHFGLTSSDVLDTAGALQLRDSLDLIIRETRSLGALLADLALEHRDTVIVGRTHGVHAEPTTLGHKVAVWAFEMERNLERLKRARETAAVGKISGAVGSYGNVDPEVERLTCESLGLSHAPASTQIVQRDRHAEVLSALAILGSTMEKIALEIRGAQRTEVRELAEPFGRGQKGSSAMPHKRNPILTERLCGMARVLRANATVGFENNALWQERDISHSSAERVVLPDSTVLAFYMLRQTKRVLEGLQVDKERMLANLNSGGGIVFSGRVLLALVEAGMSRDDAYAVVQGAAMAAWNGEGGFRELLERREETRKYLGDDLDALFDPSYALRNLGVVFERVEELRRRLAGD